MKSLIFDDIDICSYTDDFKKKIYEDALSVWCDRNMKSKIEKKLMFDCCQTLNIANISFHFSSEEDSSFGEPILELGINEIREIYFSCNGYIEHIDSLYPSQNARLYLLEFALIFLQALLDKTKSQKTLDDILSNDAKNFFTQNRGYYNYYNNLLYTRQCNLEEYSFNCEVCGHDNPGDILVITSKKHKNNHDKQPFICCKYCYNYIREHFPTNFQRLTSQNLYASDLYNLLS